MSSGLIIAGQNEELLLIIADKFLKTFKDDIRIHVITDSNYLINYVNHSTETDVEARYSNEKETVIILEHEFYYQNLELQQYKRVILLEESIDTIQKYQNGYIGINKYLKTDVLFDFVLDHCDLREEAKKRNVRSTKVIAVYSPLGGVGKTTISVGLCRAFAGTYRKILYLNTGTQQDFGGIFPEGTLSPRTELHLAKKSHQITNTIKEDIHTYGFDYIPPTSMPLPTLGIAPDSYLYLIEELKKDNIYDYIIVDMESSISIENARIIAQADQVIFIILQDEVSAYRIKRFLNSIDRQSLEHYLFICNKYSIS